LGNGGFMFFIKQLFRLILMGVLVGISAAAVPAGAQSAPTVIKTQTTNDGFITLVLTAENPSDTAGVNNTYTWTAINNSMTTPINGVILGSHWGDWCGGGNCTPPGPTLIGIGPGCGGQSASEFPDTAHFGVWCSPATGTTLAPGFSISGSVTLRPGAGGPPDYTVYTGYISPVTGKQVFDTADTQIKQSSVVAPEPTDIQIKGTASNGSPPVGSNFTYTYQVKNAGPWGTYGGLIFVDTLPASLSYVSSFVVVSSVSRITGQTVTVAEPWCSVVGQTVMCPIDELQNGGVSGQVTITLTVMAPSVPLAIANTASVHTVLPQEDSNTANNSVTVNVTAK
jgi:uncharacterized repeat protein (TIGR01451 family)